MSRRPLLHRVHEDQGMALITVLGVVAIGSAAILLMIAARDTGITRTSTEREATQARAYARGGELSAIVALRRDMVEAPAVDHFREPWAEVADREVEIEGGRFTLEITDAQDRFNLNEVWRGGLVARGTLDSILEVAALPPVLSERIALQVATLGPYRDISQLASLGLSPDDLERLSRVATVLPPGAPVNINTAGPEVIGAVIRSPVAARLLVQRRDREGFLTPVDLEGVGVVAPGGIGFTSDTYRVAVEVQVGETRQRVASVLRRRRSATGPEVVVVHRRREAPRLGGAEGSSRR